MKISASIYSNPNEPLETTIARLDANHVDWFHVDCNDSLAVFEDIKKIRQLSNKPIDLHIITPHPSKYYPYLRETPVDYVTFQVEDLQESLEVPADVPGKLGLAVITPTSIEAFASYSDRFSFILIMATIPGQSGGVFDKVNFQKIRQFRQQYPDKRIHVDGGVNAEVSFIIRNMGVDAAVSGSFLFKGGEIGRALLSLKAIETASHFLVKDIMRGRDEIPVLGPQNRSFQEVVLSIEKGGLGLTVLADEHDQLEGIISNADLRRGLIKNLHHIEKTSVADMLNTHPVVIEEDKTVGEMLEFIKQQKFPVNFLPVINTRRQITGVLTFFNLIKGEM